MKKFKLKKNKIMKKFSTPQMTRFLMVHFSKTTGGELYYMTWVEEPECKFWITAEDGKKYQIKWVEVEDENN